MPNIIKSVKYRINRLRQAPAPPSYLEVERAERIFYLEYLRENMTVFDVGANVGELTLLFSRFAGNGGSIHAFEASRAAFEKLETICKAASRRNVTLNHLALAGEKGVIRLRVYDDHYLSFNTQAEREITENGMVVEPVEIEEIRAATVDDYCEEKKIAQIDLLKIDVEGAELQVLKGARKMLELKRVKCLTFEFGQATVDMGNSAAQIECYLEETGYKIRNIIKGAPIFPGRENPANAGFSMHVAAPDLK